jgi:hypothetical protein
MYIDAISGRPQAIEQACKMLRMLLIVGIASEQREIS